MTNSKITYPHHLQLGYLIHAKESYVLAPELDLFTEIIGIVDISISQAYDYYLKIKKIIF